MGWLDKLLGKTDAASKSGAPDTSPPDPAYPKTPIIATVQIPDAAEGESGAYGDQPLRKQRAESVLAAEGVPVNATLPMIESEAEVVLRSPREIADRLRALSIIAARGGGLSEAQTRGFIAERDIGPHLTPAERAFLDTPEPSDHDNMQLSWRNEAAWVLFWALGHVDGQLGPPRDMCDVDAMTDVVINMPDLEGPSPRSANDVLNEADLIYRYHWAVRQAGIDGKPPPAGLHPGVVMERHHALNWLIGYGDNADWDEVGTDT